MMIDDLKRDCDSTGILYLSDVEKIINKQPKIGEWIPCDKGDLPEERVLCCNDRSCLIGFVYEDEMSDTGFSASDHKEYCLLNVTAWQSLPKTYKG